MGVRADIVATAKATVGHIIRFFSSSGVDVMPNRQYLDFAGNCTVNDDGTGIKVTIPEVPAGSVRVGQVETLPLDSPAYVTNTGTPTDAILNFGLPVQGMTQAQIDAATQTAVSTVQGASQTAQTTLNSTVQSTIQTVNTSLASAQDALNVSKNEAIQTINNAGEQQVSTIHGEGSEEVSAVRSQGTATIAQVQAEGATVINAASAQAHNAQVSANSANNSAIRSESSAQRSEAAAQRAEAAADVKPASDTNLGLTYLSDAVDSTLNAATGKTGASPAAVKAVNDAVTALDAAAVHIAGSETITGAKTFSEAITGNLMGNVTGNVSGNLTGNADTATTLQTARTINGTSFDGSANITTDSWGTSRTISISDSDATNTGTTVSVDGSENEVLPLPATIKASITGNVTGNLTGNVTGNVSGNAGTATKLETARSLTTKLDSTTAVTFDGSAAQDAIPVTGILPVANGGTGLNSLATFVQTSGDQTISGTKTFSSSPVVPTPAANDDSTKAVTTEWVRDYVEAKLAEIYYWAKNAQG